MIKLNGKTVVLRTFTKNDLDFQYFSWLRDKEITKFLDVQFHRISKKYATDFLEKTNQKNSFFFLISNKNTEEKIGTLRSAINVHNIADLGIMIGNKKYHGTDISLQSISLIINFLFNKKKVYKIWARCAERNFSAIYILKKLKFVLEGIQKDHVNYSKERQNSLLFGLINNKIKK